MKISIDYRQGGKSLGAVSGNLNNVPIGDSHVTCHKSQCGKAW